MHIFVLSFIWLLSSSILADEDQCNVNTCNDNASETCNAPSTSSYKPIPERRVTPTTSSCVNIHKDCEYWASSGECSANPGYMLHYCAHACNSCHLQTQSFRDDVSNCQDTFEEPESCRFWASIGECHKNPLFMKQSCRKSCNFCFYETRCDPHNPMKYENHASVSINNNLFFKRIFIDNILNNSFIVNKYGARMIHFDPPIIYFDRFLEYNNLIDEFVNEIDHNYQRSTDAGELDENFVYKKITSRGRTSTNAWCMDECQSKNSSKYILSAIEEITGIKRENFEHLQVLQYTKRQKYDRHHDFIEAQWDMPCGPRILTFFIYLNNVRKGGETAFPDIGVKVKPRKGAAVMWPNVPTNNLFSRLDATHHAALPVIKGVKHGVNAWIHLYEFMHNYDLQCTG